MGCGGSKLEEQEAVVLCRGRSDLLADAIRHRYALADAHSAYAESLLAVSGALHRLLLLPSAAAGAADGPSASPLLPLPAYRKPDPSPPPASPPPPLSSSRHSRSHSGSHLHFHPSDEESDSDSDSDSDLPLHYGEGSPFRAEEAFPPSFASVYYARSQPPAPSVAVEHRPSGVEAVRVEPTSDFSYYGYSNPSAYQFPPSYAYTPNGYGGVGGFFGPSSPPAESRPPPPAAAGMGAYGSPSSSFSKSRAPPPPPSPPRASTWDFLNPFGSYESFYPPYTPSRSSKEVRDEEGIPDLEEEEQEVVKEAYGDQKFAASTSDAVPEEYSSKTATAINDGGLGGAGEQPQYHQPSSHSKPDPEPQVVDKNVVSDEVRRPREERRRFRDDSEVVGEIKVLFDRAAESARELSELLEVGKQPYHPKRSVYEVSSRMVGVMATPSTSIDADLLDYEEDKVVNSKILSATLQKLYMWERKLYDEVRAEEKMRLLLDKNCKRLKRLDERGAEAHKVDAIQTLIRKLSTKIRIAIQVVNSISNKINKLRDEELWPQINQLIQGLSRMWKFMLECHKMQCQAISEAKSLDSVVSSGKLGDDHIDTMMQLEIELLKWVGNFSAWVNAQKNYVKALNGWLTLCLHYEPEETADGIPPYSPGRIDAPPLFVICNCWSQAMQRFSEGEAVDAMHAFAATVRHICEERSVSQNQRMMAIRDMDRWLKAVEKKTQEIHKEVDTLNRKLALLPGQTGLPVYGVVHQGHTAEVSSLQLGLRHIFEAMENFAASSVKAYEELHNRCEEERLARENAKVP